MRKTAKLFVLLAIVAVALSSCTTFQLSGAQVAKESPAYEKVGEFDTTVKVVEWLGASGGSNLFNVTADAMDSAIYDAIQSEIGKYSGDAAVNVDIRYEATFIDILLNQLTGTIYAPATAYISGDVVKYNM
jgi:predicted small secreted protein